MNDLTKHTDRLNKFFISKYIREYNEENNISMRDFVQSWQSFGSVLTLIFESDFNIWLISKHDSHETVHCTRHGLLGERLNGGEFATSLALYFADCIENKFEQEYGLTFSQCYKLNLIDTFLEDNELDFYKILSDHNLACTVDLPELEEEA